jgi:hypothetical protein
MLPRPVCGRAIGSPSGAQGRPVSRRS